MSIVLVGLVVLAIGAWLVYACRKELVLAFRSRRWPSTTGHISGTEVREGIGLGMTNDGTFAPTETSFRVSDWVFIYTVAGREYRSSRFSFSAQGWDENDRYLEDGAEVKVYYSPSDPSVSVLRPGLDAALMSGPIVSMFRLGFLVYGLCRL